MPFRLSAASQHELLDCHPQCAQGPGTKSQAQEVD